MIPQSKKEELLKQWMSKGFATRLFSDTEVADFWLREFDNLMNEKIAKIEEKKTEEGISLEEVLAYNEGLEDAITILKE